MNNSMNGLNSNSVDSEINRGADAAKSLSKKANASLTDIANNVTKQAGDMVSQASGLSSSAYKRSCDFVKEHPVQGVAIAAAAGLFAGGLFSVLTRKNH